MRDLISWRYLSSTWKNSEPMIVPHRLLVLALSFAIALSLSSGRNYTEQLNATAVNTINARDWCPESIQNLLVNEGLDDIEADKDGRHKLYIVLMAPFPAMDPANDPSWAAGDVLAPVVQLALDQINNRDDILTDYKLVMLAKDTFCSRGYKVWKAIIDLLRSEKQIVGIVGPGCSGAAIDVAEQIRQPSYSLIGITPSATSPNLEKPKYNNTFATISSGTVYVRVFKELMDYNRWNAVSVLYDERRNYFLDLFTHFENSVDNNRIAYKSPVSVSDDVEEKFFPLTDITGMDRGRVILTFAASSTARNMICLAYHYEIMYPTYQWVFPDRTISQLHQSVAFVYGGTHFNCSKEDMAKALHGILLIDYAIVPEDSHVISPTGQSYGEFASSFIDSLCNIETVSKYANTYYDAAWALAFALNRTAARMNLTSYRYGQPNITKEIRNELLNVHFNGASGPIHFDDERRSATTEINVFQLDSTDTSDVKMVRVGYYSSDTLNITSNSSSVFIDDTFVNVPMNIHPALGVIVILLALALFGFAGILHVANTVWYNYRSIKATSPNLSHLIFGGCYLFSIAIIVYSVQQISRSSETVYSVLCNTFKWCFILGYTLIFGTVLAKVWRVYRLFKHFRNESPGCLVTDNALVIFVILLLFVDLCICTIWDAIDPFVRRESIAATVEINKIPSLLIRSECECIFFVYWVAIIGTYKGAIALLLVAFSILNRKIRRRDFQHTKKINILIYSLTMMGGVLFPIFFLLRNSDIHISFVVLCLMLSVAVLMSCLLLFLTPVGQVIKIKMGLAEDASFRSEFKRRVSTVSILSFRSSNVEESRYE